MIGTGGSTTVNTAAISQNTHAVPVQRFSNERADQSGKGSTEQPIAEPIAQEDCSAPMEDTAIATATLLSRDLEKPHKSPLLENILPSPAPSEEHRENRVCIVDLETEAEEEAAVISGQPVSSTNEGSEGAEQLSTLSASDALRRLTEEYGGLDQIKKRLRYSEAQDRPSVATNVQPPATVLLGINAEADRQDQASIVNSLDETNRSLDRLPADVVITMQPLSEDIAQRIQQVQGQPEAAAIQMPRLKLLQDAVHQNDAFYVLLHQVYCLNSLSPPMVRSAARRGFTYTHSQGLEILKNLLLDNHQMGFEAVNWFSMKPSPLEKLLQSSSAYKFKFAQILEFLSNMSQQWIRVKEDCRRRQCPPSPNEMVVILGLPSKTLQSVIFRAVLREIWPGAQDHCFQLCEKVLPTYQDRTLNMRKSSSPPTATDDKAFQKDIRKIWTQHQNAHIHRTVQSRPLQAQRQSLQRRQSHPRSLSGASPHVVAIASGGFTPPVPSSSSHSPVTPVDSSTRPLWSPSSVSQRPQQIPTSFFNNRSSQDPATTVNTPILNSQAVSHSWSASQQSPSTLLIPSNHQLSGQGPGRTGGLRPHLSADQVLPSQVAAYSNAVGQAATSSSSPRSNDQLPSPQLPSHSQQFRFQPNIQPGNPYMLPQSALADIGNPFLRPAALNPQTTTSFSALHQAHATNPTLSVIKKDFEAPDDKYFMYLKDVQLSPERLHACKRHMKWSFEMQREEIQSIATSSLSSAGHVAQVKLGSCLARLRSIEVSSLAADSRENDWVVAENSWPDSLAIILNGKALEVRRKIHHGKDLPIHLNDLREGQNTISIAVSKIADETIYAIAIEISQLTNTSLIKDGLVRMDWQEARQRILRTQTTPNPDADIQILDPRIDVDLSDPHTSSLCFLPVRSQYCRHLQCFDLDIFLSTRNGTASEPCSPDRFKCPICGADARPQSLVLDEFLLKVREELQRMDRLDAKIISIIESGDWQIKEAEGMGETGDGIGKRKSETHVASAKIPSMPVSDVIDLDSDD